MGYFKIERKKTNKNKLIANRKEEEKYFDILCFI